MKTYAFIIILLFSIDGHSKKQSAFVNYIDMARDFVSNSWMGLTGGIDRFFALERYQEENDSQIRLDYILRKAEFEEFDTGARFKVKVRLRSLQKRLRLFVESNEQEDQLGTQTLLLPEAERASLEDNDFATGLELATKPSRPLNFATRVGARLRNGFDPFIRFRLRKRFEFKNFALQLTEQVRLRDSDSITEYTFADIDVPISDNLVFLWQNFKVWEDPTDIMTFGHALGLYHTLSDRRGVSYNFRLTAENKPIVSYNLWETFIIYRQLIHKDWFYIEIIPSMSWDRGFDFRQTAALEIKFQIFFN